MAKGKALIPILIEFISDVRQIIDNVRKQFFLAHHK